MNLKRSWNKFWNLLWKDNSLKGWVFSIIFLVVFFKFLFLPGLGLITGTSLPLAIVDSCSMHHDKNVFSNYDNWWEIHETKYSKYEIVKEEFKNFFFPKGFSKGDILFVVRANPEKLKIGDVIIFEGGQANPIIHRIINIKNENKEYIFSTIGDNNKGQLSIEESINENKLVGKAVGRIVPWLGWGKLIFYEHLRPESERGLCKEN